MAVQSDPYLLFYGIIPVWLVAVGMQLPRGSSEIWLVRDGSQSRHYLRWISAAFRAALVVSVIPTIAGLAAASGLPLSDTWTSPALESSNSLDHAGVAPLVALLGQVVLVGFALTALASAAFVLRSRWPTPTGTVVILAGMFVLLLIGGMGSGPLQLSGLFLMFMHDSLSQVTSTLAGLVVWVLGWWLLISWWERRHVQPRPALGALLGPGIGLVVIVVSHALPLSASAFTWADLLHRTFAGGDTTRINPLGFTSYALIFGMGALWIGSRIVLHDRDRLPLVAIRHGRLDRWGFVVFSRIVAASATLIVALMLISGLVAAAFGATLISPDLGLFLTYVGAIGVLQTIFLAILTAATVVISDEPRTVFAVFAATLFLALPPLNRGRFLPFGLSLTGTPNPDLIFRDLSVISLTVLAAGVFAVLLTRCAAVQRRILGRI